MSNYCYEAVDSGGLKTEGTLEVPDQSEALRRIKEMGLFPTRIIEAGRRRQISFRPAVVSRKTFSLAIPLFGGRVKPAALAVFTRQLATLLEAGMPLLRGLRLLHEQAENPALKRVITEMISSIEGGDSLSDALTAHPKTFNPLYVNMVKAGELGGALELTLRRLAEFQERARKIKGKIKAALFYPTAVMTVAVAILGLLMVYVIPKFKEVFAGLTGGAALPQFTQLVLNLSDAIKNHVFAIAGLAIATSVMFTAMLRTKSGRQLFDRLKLTMPLFGPVFRKSAVARFARTLGTLLGSGVPILQALNIVKETTGNVVVSSVVGTVHDRVKQGDSIAVPMKASGVFPAMVAGMVDVGEQTGALPDMLLKIADNYDEEVDNAASAMTSMLEPIMIVFLAVVVGSIVIAMFLPIISIIGGGMPGPDGANFQN